MFASEWRNFRNVDLETVGNRLFNRSGIRSGMNKQNLENYSSDSPIIQEWFLVPREPFWMLKPIDADLGIDDFRSGEPEDSSETISARFRQREGVVSK